MFMKTDTQVEELQQTSFSINSNPSLDIREPKPSAMECSSAGQQEVLWCGMGRVQ